MEQKSERGQWVDVIREGFHESILPTYNNVTLRAIRASLVAQLVKNLPAMWETWVRFLVWEDIPGEGTGYPLQYSVLENSMNCIVHGISKSQT